MRLRKVPDTRGPEPPRNHRDELLLAARLAVLADLAAGMDATARAALARPNPALPEGALLEPWPLKHIEVVEANDEERVARGFVDRALAEGWATLDRGKLVLHTRPKLTYRVVRTPGVYCCHCEAELDAGNQTARAHVTDCALGEPSPDPENPAGYRVTDIYELERVS